MQLPKNKTAGTLTLILMMTFATIGACIPIVNAANYSTFAYLSCAPNPIGVDQTLTVTMWLSNLPILDAKGWAIPWDGFTVTITKPDGRNETKGPYSSDPVGMWYLEYTPDQTGTYYFQFSFPGQTIGSNYYKPSTSSRVAVTVQQEQTPLYPGQPLPADYWTRPISHENREWWSISGNWLMRAYDTTYRSHLIGSAFAPYTTAPNTAHIVWTKPISFGGLVGGEYGDIDYYTGLSYELKIWDKIIMNGRLYYNTPDPPLDGFYCVDLRTGETIWKQEHGSIDLGQLYDYESPNQHGVIPYLWDVGSTYTLYDAFTGNPILYLANATTTSRRGFVFSKNGDLLLYMLDGGKNWLAMWNSSKAIPTAGATGTNAWQWRPDNYRGKTLDWRKGIQWNVTVPDVPGSQTLYELTSDTIIAKVDLGFTSEDIHTYVDVAYSLKEGSEGQQLWVQNRTITGGASIYAYPNWAAEGVYTVHTIETCETFAYDIYTGQQLWATKPNNPSPWDIYKTGFIIAYGKYYWSGYANIYCLDLKNGTELWRYNTGNSGFETPYGTWPPYAGQLIADGKIYQNTGEHSPNTPLYRGESLHCINATTGERIWSIRGWFPQGAIADGYFVTLNIGDNQLYCFGKGQTATTVSASPEVSVHGSSVLIQGTVTDQSPFATGTPAIADESMSAWMEHLYMQQSIPTNATGVEVTLDTIDPNGNFVHIGTATSDISGMFKKAFVPEVPGEYTIIATFAGSESYFSSYAETAINVDEAPPPTAAPEYPQPFDYTMHFVVVGIAIIIAIAIVGLLILRKR